MTFRPRISNGRRGLFLAGILALAAAPLTTVVAAFAEDETPPPIETTAREAMLLDGKTGTVLFQKQPDEAFAPGSLAKMMTMDIVFGAVKSGKLSLDHEFPVSEHAWRTGGAPSRTSTMFAKLGSNMRVGDLIRGAIVQSANDAAIVLAEGMAGTEKDFAKLMNERAAELGLTHSRFANPTGLPADGERVTARDLVTLARHIRSTYPDLYKIYAEPAFKWNNIYQRNRNPLLDMGIGADGMETGYTEDGGYGLLGVTDRGGRTTYVALAGLPSEKARSEEARKLLDYAQQGFVPRTLFEADQKIGRIGVFGGTTTSVGLSPKGPVDALVPTREGDHVKAIIRYDGPALAPIAKGEKIAVLEIFVDGRLSKSQDLFADASVGKGSFSDRAVGAAKELATGWMRAF